MPRLLPLAALIAALPLTAHADIALTGPDGLNVTLTRADLEALPAHEAVAGYRSARDQNITFRGALLWDVIAAQTDLDEDVKAALRYGILASADDGHAVLVSLGEIAPDFGAREVLIAYQRSDVDGEASLQLVSPGDERGARHIHGLVSLEIR